MAEIIYSKNGEMKCTAKSVRYTGSFMGVPQLEVEIDGPVPLGFEVGDYIVFSYDGIRYSIIDLPQVQKQSSSGSVGNAFVYENVVFKSPLGLLSSIDFLDTVLSDNNIHYSTLPVFSFFGDIKDFADRLQANLNRIYSSGWKVTVEGYDDSSNANYDILHDYKEISLSNQNCLDALSIPYETWKITYVFMLDSNGNNCIVFNHALDAASAKSYGKGNGLYSLTKRMSAEKPVITRLRAYGSTDNLPARYYNNLDGIDDGIYLPNLMIPRSKWKNQNDPITAYIDSTDIDENDISMSRYGVREKSIYFDGSNDTEKIEPTIKGVTAGMIRAAKEEMGDTSNVPYATLYPDDERMDKIVEAESIADKGVESDGEVYMDSIGFNVSKGEDRTVVGTKNGLDPIIEDLETSMEISTPATYKVVSGNPTPFCRFNTGVGIVVDSAILNVYTVDEDGVKTLCDSVKIYSEFISGVNPGGGRYAYRDFYFAGSNGKDSPLYIKVPYKGVLLFQYNIDAGGVDSVSLTMSAVSLTASTGPIILQNKFWVRIKQIGFDINSYPSTGEAKLVVNSGGCSGRSFNIVKNSTQFDEATGTWKFECFRSQDESLNQLFPNSIYKISEDDEFVLTGLEMPDLYVQMASQKLYDEAVKWLWKHKDGLEVFELDIDNKVAYLDSVKIKEGMLLPLYDGNLNVGSEAENEEGETVITYDYRIIDSVTIEIGEKPVPVITAVLREEKEERIFKLLNKKVSEITARTTQNAVRMQVIKITEEVIRTTASTSASTPSAVINTSDFVTLSTDQTITGEKRFESGFLIGPADGAVRVSVVGGRLHVSSTVTSDGDFVAFGDEEGGAGSGGLDVARLWQELEAKDPSKVIDASHIPSITKAKISDFPTKWAWADISGKPSTFAPSAHSHAISDVTGLQGELNSKWVWSESQVKAVKVNSAVSADNADTLDGVHANGLLTALTSSADTNLSITVGGKPLSVADLYAKYADQLRTARKINGTEFLGTQDITTAKWGMARSMRIGDYYGSNGAAVSIDGSSTSGYVLPLPQSIKVKTLDVDGVTLSVVDGRLHISATATSAGDFVAYGDEAGSSGSGGLDVARLWQELGGSVSNKVIAIEHIPSIPTSKITGLDNALSGYVSSVTTSGAGNAVTGYAKSGNTLTLKKDLTFLTSVSLATISDLHSSWDAVLKAQKPAWLTTVSLATISDLNSSWDALLKVAPTKYVTRWPTASEVGALTQATADGRYLRLSGGTMSGDITMSGCSIRIPQSPSASSYNGILNADGSKAILAYYGDNTYTGLMTGTHYLRSGATSLIHRRNGADYTILDTGNYTGVLDSRYMRIGSSGYPTAYRKVFNLNGTAWSFLGTTTDAPTAYAPTTAGTSGYVLQSTGGTPAWAAQSSLVVKGIYERSLGVAAGDTMADLKSALTTQMGSGLNKPGSMGFVTTAAVANIMSNWANDDYKLVAGSRTNFLRLDGYGSSTYGVFLVSGYLGSFYRLLKNSSTAWGGPYLILDTGNYASTLDSRYVNISGDTMTGTLKINSSSEAFIRYQISGSSKAASGYLASQGAYLYSYPANKYLHITDAGSLLFGSSTVWHSGNDGPGSGLNADLLDGYQASSFLLRSGGTMTGNLTLKSMGGTWLGGKTQAPIMTNGASSTSGNTYHPVIWGKTDAGDVWNLGHGASDQVGFFGFYSERTTNGTDWAHYIKVSDGTVHFNKTVYGTTFSGTLSGNATSATKLQTSRTLWGRPFNGEGNVSGDMTGVGRIVASGPIRTYSINIECDDTGTLGGYAGEINRIGLKNPLYLQHRGGNLYICANGGNVGIGTTSSAYKLDVAGEIRATSGITIGSTDDIGWYPNENRITAGHSIARGVNVGSLLVSNAWADYTKVPTNGIYSKGDIWTGGKLYIPSSSGNNVFDAYIA